MTRDSPFVAMAPRPRVMVMIGFAGSLMLILFVALAIPRGASLGILLAVTGLVAVLILPLVFYRSSFGWFHPLIFIPLVHLSSLIRSSPLYVVGLDSHVALPSYTRDQLMGLVAYQLILTAAGLLAYFFAFLFLPSPRVPRFRFVIPPVPRLRRRAILTVLFSGLVFMIYLQTQGGLVAHLLSWGQGRRVALAGEHYWLPPIQLGVLACLVWLVSDSHFYRRPFFWASSAVAFPIIFLFGGSRSAVLNFIIIALIAWMMTRKKIAYTRMLLAAALAIVLLAALGNLRRATWQGELWSPVEGGLSFSSLALAATDELVSRSTNESTQLPILARVPHEVGLLYGGTYLAVLTLPVPRAVWPEKPELVQGLVGEVFFGVQSGRPGGAVGEAYWNFHIPGVLLVFGLFGVFHRWLVRFVQIYPQVPAAALLYATSLWTLTSPTGPGVYRLLLINGSLIVLLWLFGCLRPAWGTKSPAAVDAVTLAGHSAPGKV